MKIQKIITLNKAYIYGGIIGAIALLALFVIGYFLIYKKILKGKKRIRIRRMLWWTVFITLCYGVVGYTIMSQRVVEDKEGYVGLLHHYKLALNSFKEEIWMDILINYIMFIPLGIVIPFGIKKCRHLIMMILTGGILAFLVQMIQLYSSKRVFEMDDMLGNAVGTVVGYGIAAIIFELYYVAKKVKKFDYKRALLLQVPLALAVCSLGMLFISYSIQDTGNNPYEAIEPHKADQFEVTIAKELSTNKENLITYQQKEYTTEEALDIGKGIFDKLKVSIDEDRTVATDNRITIYSQEGTQYSVNVDFVGGTFQFYDFEESIRDVPLKKKKNANKETIIAALEKYGVTVPGNAEFTELDDGHYQFKVNKSMTEDGMINGAIICDYHGKGKFSSIHSSVSFWEPYNDYPAKSEVEAFEEINKGMFIYDGAEKDKLKIKVMDVSITYIMDTKGFYQPVYLFKCEINGKDDNIVIPAY